MKRSKIGLVHWLIALPTMFLGLMFFALWVDDKHVIINHFIIIIGFLFPSILYAVFRFTIYNKPDYISSKEEAKK